MKPSFPAAQAAFPGYIFPEYIFHRFSFGTLPDPVVQQSVFGRELPGSADVLRGFRLGVLTISDPEVIKLSGLSGHPLLMPSSDPADEVRGQVLAITADDLAAADAYEVDDYARIEVALASGTVAWVYLDKTCLRDDSARRGLLPWADDKGDRG